MKILVTAFEAFGNVSTNVSLKALEALDFKEITKKLILPVSYDKVKVILEKELKENDYDLIINLGQAGGRRKVTLERYALNYKHASIPDNDNYLANKERIIDNGLSSYETSLAIENIVSKLENSLPIDVSLHAGTYVCNTTYYHALRLNSNKALFIHLPYYQNQEGIGEVFSLDFALIMKTLNEVFKSIINLC